MTFLKRRTLLVIALLHLGVYLILGLLPHYFAGENAVVPYAAQRIDTQATFQAPSWKLDTHFFGTDHLGRDVLSGIIHGCQTSLWVSFPAMLIVSFIGLGLGLISGYFGNHGMKVKMRALVALFATLPIGGYYSIYLLQFPIAEAFKNSFFNGTVILLLCFGIILLIFLVLYFLLHNIGIQRRFFASHVALPLDEAVLKLIELFSSIPRLILIVAFAAFLKPSLAVLVAIIGFTSWTGMARLVRGEVLKVKSRQYVEAGLALGLKDRVVVLKHIVPNIMPAIVVAFTFGLASLLGIEATLSFLGIGLPPDYVSWGRIIAGVRYNLSAWWLVVFPGLYLSLTVFALHYCSNYLLRR